MINKYRNILKGEGFLFEDIDDFSLKIKFSNCTIKVFETLSDKLLVQIYDTKGNKQLARSYKTIRGALNFMLRYID
jgi:hypothetical protein